MWRGLWGVRRTGILGPDMDAETSTRVGPNPAVLAQLAKIGLGGPLESVLSDVVKLAQEHVAGVDEASITIQRHQRATTAAFTGEAALELDERQYAAGYGPCLDALAGGALVIVPDTSRDQTYPYFSPRARALGFTHTLSVDMPMAAGTSGALNLYGRGEGPFSDDALQAAQAFVDYAAMAVTTPRRTPIPPNWPSRCTRRCSRGPSSSRPRASSSETTGAPPTRPSHAGERVQPLQPQAARRRSILGRVDSTRRVARESPGAQRGSRRRRPCPPVVAVAAPRCPPRGQYRRWPLRRPTGRGVHEERLGQLQAPVSRAGCATSAEFWSRALQNWRSEMLAVGSMAVLSIYLRQRGSPESKPVSEPHDSTGISG